MSPTERTELEDFQKAEYDTKLRQKLYKWFPIK
jgi:hypothetical protein